MTLDSNTGIYLNSLIELSGEFKIVVETNGNLHFDDYTGRKINIDKTQPILPQIGNFVQVSSKVKEELTYHGGYRDHKILKFHFPLYLSPDEKRLPKYFVLYEKADLTNPILKNIVDLEKVGLHKIFNEIIALTLNNKKIKNPVFFNWSGNSGERSFTIFGYDVSKQTTTQRSYIIDDLVLNRTSEKSDLNFFNDYVLSKFKDPLNPRLIFPRYINIEVEFEPSKSILSYPLENYHAYLSYDNEVSLKDFVKSNIKFNTDIKVKELSDTEFSYNLINVDIPKLLDYNVIDKTITVKDINEQDYLYRFIVNNYQRGDIFKFYALNEKTQTENLVFTYVVKDADIKTTQIQTIQKICKNISLASEYMITASLSDPNLKIVEFLSFLSLRIELPNYVRYNVLDRQTVNFQFNQNIINKDVLFVSASDYLDINTYSQLSIDGNIYKILKNFKYRDYYCLRLDRNSKITSDKSAFLIKTKKETIKALTPINYINKESSYNILPLFDIDSYKENLLSKVGDSSTNIIIDNKIKNYSKDILDKFNDVFPLEIKDQTSISIESKTLITSGIGCHLTPHVMNYDIQFGNKNGLYDILNYLDIKTEQYSFSWFLIKGDCPEYLKNDVRSLRYFTDTPQLYSKMIEVGDFYCETVFLGIRYRLPIRYKDYNFSVYLNPDDSDYSSPYYNLEIDIVNKLIHLVINRYLDFSDLIRFGNVSNKPLIDLSLFYNIKVALNDSQRQQSLFQEIGYRVGNANLVGDIYSSSFKNLGLAKDWIFNKDISGTNTDYYFLVSRSKPNYDFTLIYNEGSSPEAHYYVNIPVYNSEMQIERKDVRLFTVRFEKITSINEEYFWCKDIVYRLYPENMYLWLHPLEDRDENDKAVYTLVDSYIYDESYNDPQKFQTKYKQYYTTINEDDNIKIKVVKFLLDVTDSNTTDISLRNQYFRLSYIPDRDTSTIIKELFFIKNDVDQTYAAPKKIFYDQNTTISDIETLVRGYESEDFSAINELDLFSTNPVWSMLRNMTKMLSTNVLSINQVETILRDFSIGNFYKYLNGKSIPLKDFEGNDLNYNVDLKIMLPSANKQKTDKIIRQSTYYNPYMIDIPQRDFQSLNKSSDVPSWKEDLGVFISRIFSFNDDITITVEHNFDISKDISLYTLFDNDEEYVRYLFDKFYKVSTVLLNSRSIEFTVDSNNYILRIDTDLVGIYNIDIILIRK